MSRRPRLLDLFCGAGGAGMGYYRAGFDVYGVDIAPQPHYPFWFRRGDAMAWPLDGFDAIHASPPCQRFIRGGAKFSTMDQEKHPDLLTPIRERLRGQDAPWVIENVPGAPMRADVVLCGSMFGLGAGPAQLRRHRWFELGGWEASELLPPCAHSDKTISVFGKVRGRGTRWGWNEGGTQDWRDAMGMDWTNERGMAQAIPPAYTEWLGRHLLGAVGMVAA